MPRALSAGRSTAAASAVALCALACGGDSTAPNGAATRVELSAPPAVLALDDTVRLRARVVDRGGSDVPGAVVRWTVGGVAAGNVVSVDSAGLVTALSVGAASVVATAGAARASVTVTVADVPSSVKIAPANTLLGAGGSVALAAVVGGRRGAVLDAPVSWSSTDASAVGVTSAGVASAVTSEGSAWITASAGGAVRDSVQVMVGYHRIANGERFVALSLFNQSLEPGGCALASGGAAYCWGGQNRWGELGTSATPSAPDQLVAVSGGHAFKEIHGGENAACALTAADGALYCWGRNYTAQFGTGALAPGSSSTPIAGAASLRFRTMTLGVSGTACGVSAADAVLYCWGHDTYLTTGKRFADVVNIDSIVAPVDGALAATQASVFDVHGCAIGADRATWCWGTGTAYGAAANSPVPVQVAPPGTFASVTAGAAATCALAPDGQAFCWGAPPVAPGTDANAVVATPTAVGGALRFTKLSLSVWNFACGLTTAGDVYCWGANDFGGNVVVGGLGRAGGPAPASSPVAVLPGRKFVDVAESCAADAAGDIYCWSQR